MVEGELNSKPWKYVELAENIVYFSLFPTR